MTLKYNHCKTCGEEIPPFEKECPFHGICDECGTITYWNEDEERMTCDYCEGKCVFEYTVNRKSCNNIWVVLCTGCNMKLCHKHRNSCRCDFYG